MMRTACLVSSGITDDEEELSSEDRDSSWIIDDIIYNIQNSENVTSSVDIPEALHDFVEVSSRLYQCFNNVNEENEILLVDQVPSNVTGASFYKLANIDYTAASTCVEHISPLVTEPSAYNWRDFPVNHYDLENDIDGSVKSSHKFILTPSWFLCIL